MIDLTLPSFFDELPLKSKLSWLYYRVYGRLPVVRTGAASRILSLVRDIEIRKAESATAEEIDQRLFSLATDCVLTYPQTTAVMGKWADMGVGYYLFCAPTCFFMPYLLFFHSGEIRSPWIDPVRENLHNALSGAVHTELGGMEEHRKF